MVSSEIMNDLIDNRYRIIKTLGSGLSGDVLAVEDKDGLKALKFLKRIQLNVSKEEALANFKNEFTILSELNHPGIARILDFGLDTRVNKYYFTTELVDGGDLYAMTENVSMEVIEDLFVQILRALNYLHLRGIYHFDIKPQNLLVRKDGEKLTAKMIDFGLAGFSSPRKKVGTPAYMAPEVILGGVLDGRTDLYSLGVLMYKVLTRTNPFANKKLKETLDNQKTLIPDAPSKLNPQVPAHWDRIVMRLLEKKPSDRYSNGSAVIRDVNLLSHSDYEIETQDTRLSYLPEKGSLIGRKQCFDIFHKQFNTVFNSTEVSDSHLLILEGATGTGKSRLLSEFKYHSQLKDVPVFTWTSFQEQSPQPPFCLQLDDADPIGPDQVNLLVQKYAKNPVMIIWAVAKAPLGWTQCEIVQLNNFSMEELKEYIVMVTGLKDPPQKMLEEVFSRTDGNPLFVTELIKTMLANNLLLDSSGRWASSTFEDIGINFEKIKVPQTLSGLLFGKYNACNENEKEILNWLALFNQNLSLQSLKFLTHQQDLQKSILDLTKNDLIKRTDREHHYFFSNVLIRDVIYDSLSSDIKGRMHDHAACFLKEKKDQFRDYLFHLGLGSSDDEGTKALVELGKLNLERERFSQAIDCFRSALDRSSHLNEDKQNEIRLLLAETMRQARHFKESIEHYLIIKAKIESNTIQINRDEKREILEKIGDIYSKLNQFDQAAEILNRLMDELSDEPDNQVLKIRIQNYIANVYMKKGDIETAERIFKENYKIWFDDFTDEERSQVTNNWIVDVYRLKKDYDSALKYVQRDIAINQKIGNQFYLARAYYYQGDIFFQKTLETQGSTKNHNVELSLESFDKCLDISKKIESPSMSAEMMMRAYNGIGNLYFHEHQLDKAENYYQRALALARKQEDFSTAITMSLNIGNIAQEQSRFRDAFPYYVYVLNALGSREHKTPHNWELLFRCHAELATTYREMDEMAKAEEHINLADEIMNSQKHLKAYEFWVWLERTRIYHKQNHQSLWKESLDKAEKLAKGSFEKDALEKFKKAVNGSSSLEEKSVPTARSAWKVKKMSEINKDVSVNDLETILKINKFINSEHDLTFLLKMVLNYALDLSGAESGLVLLLNESGQLEVKESINTQVDDELKRISTSVANQAIETGEIVVSEDALEDDRFDSSESIVINELKSILCLPLKSKNKVIGVLYLDNRMRSSAFENANFKVLNAYCDQVGIALENTRLIQAYRETQEKLKGQLLQAEDELEIVKDKLKDGGSTKYSYSQIIATSKPMQDTFRVLDKITETNLAVFIHGASGTGKELIAKAIHANNPTRSNKRFVAINCGAIPANLIESELFGHKAGSFTGANKDKIGLFEEANGGTLFLDEICELEPNLQVKLLRVLQEGEVQRLGDVKPVKVDVRIVSASHKPIEQLLEKGQFREDLFYRLCQIKVELPALKDRQEDIPLLAHHFVNKFAAENGVQEKVRIEPAMMRAMVAYSWPGNVRELENTMQVACALREGDLITLNTLPANYGIVEQMKTMGEFAVIEGGGLSPKAQKVSIDDHNIFDPLKTWDQYEILIIAKCYQAMEFKKGQTSEMLGVSPSTLYKKIKEHDLDNKDHALYKQDFKYEMNRTLKSYILPIFQAALTFADDHPYAAIRQLGVSQGYFYKVMKQVQHKQA